MNWYKLATFIFYLVGMLGIGIFFFFKSKDKSEKDYFLGGRNMNGLVAAFSAGASDMSAWVLMGLPGAIYVSGLSQVWISVGLILGTILAWVFVAPRLRRFAIVADDAITIPEFLTKRFKETNPALRIACAVIFVIGYCVYTASSIVACGDVFVAIMPAAKDYKLIVEIVAGCVIVLYTLLGGFNAVCWTDLFQGMLMLMALMIVPIIAASMLSVGGPVEGAIVVTPDSYYNLFAGETVWQSIANVLTGLGWGLGYFGMPHILVRYMSIKSEKEMKKSQTIGIVWIIIILAMATIAALIAHEFLGNTVTASEKSTVFIKMIDAIFDKGALAILGGIFLSAIVAASMSTADSQLLASSSAFSSDIYKAAIKKNASDKEMLWVGRIAVAIILVIAILIALFASQDIMSLVSAAWSIFGAAFGPAILLSLFWKRFNYQGACWGIISGFVVSVLWMVLFNFEYYGFKSVVANTYLYEIIPGFIVGLIVAVIVTLTTKAPSQEVVELFEKVDAYKESEQ